MSESITYFHLRSIAAGVAYGVLIRLLMAIDIDAVSGLMSWSFFVLSPTAIGFIVVYLDPATTTRGPLRDLAAPAVAMIAFLLSTIVLMLEGSICVLIAMPWFLVFACAGGLVAGWLRRRKLLRGQTLSLVLLLPIVASPFEAHLPVSDSHLRRQDSILVQASPEVVWAQITNVGEINGNELRLGLTRLLGVPRPVSASMDFSEGSPVRRTNWDKGVYFEEVITLWTENEAMEWRFVFHEDSVPPGVLDQHVQIGGDHFDLNAGGYILKRRSDGATELTLSTSYRVSSRPKIYTEWWANLIMRDFHLMILELIKDRSEDMQANHALHPTLDPSRLALPLQAACVKCG